MPTRTSLGRIAKKPAKVNAPAHTGRGTCRALGITSQNTPSTRPVRKATPPHQMESSPNRSVNVPAEPAPRRPRATIPNALRCIGAG